VDLGEDSVVVVGAGLVGCLLGVYLRKLNFSVTLFEARPDPRIAADSGRSINLVITSRGIAALTTFSEDLAEKVMAITTPVFGRTLHSPIGQLTYQPYGPDSSFCNFSVSRLELNITLIKAAEEAGCKIHFSHPLTHIDVPGRSLYFYLNHGSQLYQKKVKCGQIFGADGGGSRTRQALKGYLNDKASDLSQPLNYGYKELTMPIPPDPAKFNIESLHIWPRGSHFMMALPNKDHSFTITLYMPEKGPISFQSVNTLEKARAYFQEFYPDAIPLMPHFDTEYMRNPVGFLGTVFMSPWVVEDKIALIGDAAHAITPFFGQGCNSGFEDVMVLSDILRDIPRCKLNMGEVLGRYYQLRKPNADAIANMALENFIEMMLKTADAKFLLTKEIEIELCNRYPSHYASRYQLVTHSLIPYSQCQQIGVLQQTILTRLAQHVTSVDQVDYDLAKRLIDEHLVPYLNQHNISAKDFNYVSKYYPAPKQASKL